MNKTAIDLVAAKLESGRTINDCDVHTLLREAKALAQELAALKAAISPQLASPTN